MDTSCFTFVFGWRLVTSFLGLAVTLVSPIRAEETPLSVAITQFNARKFTDARPVFERLAREPSTKLEALNYLAQIALFFKDHKLAMKYLGDATSIAPNEGRLHMSLGDAYALAVLEASIFSKLDLANKCRAEYRRAIELEPSNVDFRMRLLRYYIEAPGIAEGGIDKAFLEAANIRKIDVRGGYFAYATVYAAEKRYSKAIGELDEYLQNSPDDYELLLEIGRLARLGNVKLTRGINALNRATSLPVPPGAPDHALAHWRLGNLYEKRGDAAEAKAAYETATRLNPAFEAPANRLKKMSEKTAVKSP